jgi:hypothetical protein
MGMQDFVYLNRGTLDGLEVGSPLEVYRAGYAARETTRDENVAVPPRAIAKLIVVRAEEQTAVAMVTTTETELALGDQFRGEHPQQRRARASRSRRAGRAAQSGSPGRPRPRARVPSSGRPVPRSRRGGRSRARGGQEWLALQAAGALRPRECSDALRSGMHPRDLLARLAERVPDDRWLERGERRLAQLGAVLVPWGSRDYPPRLAELSDAPPVLALRGDPDALAHTAVAIVGSRAASAYGLEVARRVAGELASAGVVVVSGLAFGIDAAAHEGRARRGWAHGRGAGVRDRPRLSRGAPRARGSDRAQRRGDHGVRARRRAAACILSAAQPADQRTRARAGGGRGA